MLREWLIQLHTYQTSFSDLGGQHWFLIESLILGFLICWWGIPITTDMMVNASAGLANKHFGPKSRTMVINASTNNPELANMLVSIGIGRAGGIANPLGSNFANMYLMFLIAPVWVMLRWTLRGRIDRVKALMSLLFKEKKLVATHVFMAMLMFGFANVAYWFMTGYNQFARHPEDVSLHPWNMLLTGAVVCSVGVLLFVLWDRLMKRWRPELFEDIDEEEHSERWLTFFAGTAGLILISYVLNELFLSWSQVYESTLSGYFGAAIFAGLHFFVGALVTSLPELKVAVDNYEKVASPDLNTALSSASVSNMTNLAIAILGIVLIGILSVLRFKIEL